jgi:hypothetical protein
MLLYVELYLVVILYFRCTSMCLNRLVALRCTQTGYMLSSSCDHEPSFVTDLQDVFTHGRFQVVGHVLLLSTLIQEQGVFVQSGQSRCSKFPTTSCSELSGSMGKTTRNGGTNSDGPSAPPLRLPRIMCRSQNTKHAIG